MVQGLRLRLRSGVVVQIYGQGLWSLKFRVYVYAVNEKIRLFKTMGIWTWFYVYAPESLILIL